MSSQERREDHSRERRHRRRPPQASNIGRRHLEAGTTSHLIKTSKHLQAGRLRHPHQVGHLDFPLLGHHRRHWRQPHRAHGHDQPQPDRGFIGHLFQSAQITGKSYAADYVPPTPSMTTTAISDMETAYIDAAGRSIPYGTNINIKAGLTAWTTSLHLPVHRYCHRRQRCGGHASGRRRRRRHSPGLHHRLTAGRIHRCQNDVAPP